MSQGDKATGSRREISVGFGGFGHRAKGCPFPKFLAKKVFWALHFQIPWVLCVPMEFDLHSTAEIIDELGGNPAVAELTGTGNAKAVSNWRSSNLFPAWTYLILTNALQALGKTA